MLVPGATFGPDGRLDVTVGAGIAPDFINQGFGFMNSGALAIDTGAPVGDFYVKGFRVSQLGAIYGETVPVDGGFAEGIYRNASGVLVFDPDPVPPVSFSSRNPISANDLLAVV